MKRRARARVPDLCQEGLIYSIYLFLPSGGAGPLSASVRNADVLRSSLLARPSPAGLDPSPGR